VPKVHWYDLNNREFFFYIFLSFNQLHGHNQLCQKEEDKVEAFVCFRHTKRDTT
jgi:hypothetical protein